MVDIVDASCHGTGLQNAETMDAGTVHRCTDAAIA